MSDANQRTIAPHEPRVWPVVGLKSRLKAVAAASGVRGAQLKLKARLDARLAYWESPDAAADVKTLESLSSNKLLMRRYVKSLGLRLPEIYSDAADLNAIDFAKLPDRVVIKPHNGWDSDAVMVIDGERELMSGRVVPRATLQEFCRETFASARVAREPRIIVEEFVQDYDRRFAIPRDFKIFVAGGKAWVVAVIDRNGTKAERSESFYSRDWTKFADAFLTAYLPGSDVPPPPILLSYSPLLNLWQATWEHFCGSISISLPVARCSARSPFTQPPELATRHSARKIRVRRPAGRK